MKKYITLKYETVHLFNSVLEYKVISLLSLKPINELSKLSAA